MHGTSIRLTLTFIHSLSLIPPSPQVICPHGRLPATPRSQAVDSAALHCPRRRGSLTGARPERHGTVANSRRQRPRWTRFACPSVGSGSGAGGLSTIRAAIRHRGSVRNAVLGRSGVERRGVRVKSGKVCVSDSDHKGRRTLASLSLE